MALTIQNVDTPDSEAYYRIFQQALEKIDHETVRLGEERLRRGLIRGLHANEICQEISIDGYIVGYVSCQFVTFREKKYKHILGLTFGTDQNNSRSWYYSDDYAAAAIERNREDGVQGNLAISYPDSATAKSVPIRYPNSTVEILPIEQVFPEATGYSAEQRAFVITSPEE